MQAPTARQWTRWNSSTLSSSSCNRFAVALLLDGTLKEQKSEVLGQHIARGYLTEVSPSAFRDAAEKAVRSARDVLGNIYMTRRLSDSASVELRRTVWSFTYVCPACSKPMVYYRHLRKNRTAQPQACPGCGEKFVRRAWSKSDDVPVEVVVCGEDGKLVGQELQDVDLAAIEQATRDPRQTQVPSRQIEDYREMYRRSALGKHDLTETKLFFSPRNAIALMELWRAFNGVADERLRTKLRFAFTAILPRASRRYQWGPKRPLSLGTVKEKYGALYKGL